MVTMVTAPFFLCDAWPCPGPRWPSCPLLIRTLSSSWPGYLARAPAFRPLATSPPSPRGCRAGRAPFPWTEVTDLIPVNAFCCFFAFFCVL